jgi:hypothetical protein
MGSLSGEPPCADSLYSTACANYWPEIHRRSRQLAEQRIRLLLLLFDRAERRHPSARFGPPNSSASRAALFRNAPPLVRQPATQHRALGAVLIVFDDFFAFFRERLKWLHRFLPTPAFQKSQKPVEAERKIFRCAIYTPKSTELPKRTAALALEVIGFGSRVGRQGSSSRLRSAIRKAAMPAAAAASMR